MQPSAAVKLGVALAGLMALQAVAGGVYLVATASHLADDARRRSSVLSKHVYEQGFYALGGFSVLVGLLLAYGSLTWWRGQRRGRVLLLVVAGYQALGALALIARQPTVRGALTLLLSVGLLLVLRSAAGRAQTNRRSPAEQRKDRRKRVQAFDEGFGG